MHAAGEVTAVYRQYCLDSVGAFNGAVGRSDIPGSPASMMSLSLEAEPKFVADLSDVACETAIDANAEQ